MSSSRLSTVGATGTPGGLLTTQKSASSATMRACHRQLCSHAAHAVTGAGGGLVSSSGCLVLEALECGYEP